MTIKFNKTILRFFFCAVALIALSACGGSGGGGGTPTADNKPLPRTTIDTGGPAGATIIFVTTPTDMPDDFDDTDYVTRAAYTAPDAAMMATNINRNNYKSTYDTFGTDADETVEIPNDATIATVVAAIKGNTEYIWNGHANEINAAYAYARGYTGAGIIVSMMGHPIFRSHGDVNGQLVPGYTADSGETGTEGGNCSARDVDCDASTLDGTHLAGIIIGGQNGNSSMQGIAYNARGKPIDILSGDVYKTSAKNDKLRAAIAQASGSDITLMNNGWDVSGVELFSEIVGLRAGVVFYYKTANKVSTISNEEAAAWRDAVKTTVVVFGAGDYGHNEENGKVQLYGDRALTTKAKEINGDGMLTDTDKEVAWNLIDGANKNRASSHARLPLENT